ncbi:MAG: hypothetical protein ACFFCD_09260 [Promethearchaeota archaeon]
MGTIEILKPRVTEESCAPQIPEKVDIEDYIPSRWRKHGIW